MNSSILCLLLHSGDGVAENLKLFEIRSLWMRISVCSVTFGEALIRIYFEAPLSEDTSSKFERNPERLNAQLSKLSGRDVPCGSYHDMISKT